MIHIPFKTINENLFYERAKGAYKAINPVRLKGKEVKSVVSGCYFPRNNSDPSKDLLLRMASKIPESINENSNILLVNDMGLQWVKYLYEKYNIKKFTILCVSNGYASEKAVKSILTHDVTRLWDMGDIEVTPVYFDEVKDKMFDLVIMNPPFFIGNDITSSTMKICKEAICLMPISKYRKGNLVSLIEDIQIEDPKAFDGLAIPENMAIAHLKKGLKGSLTYQDLELMSFDPLWRAFYEENLKLTPSWEWVDGNISKISKEFNPNYFYLTVRTIVDGVHKTPNCADYKMNFLHQYTYTTEIAVAKFKSKKERDNIVNFWYNSNIMTPICKGTRKQGGSGTSPIFLPRIDWSKDILYTDDYVLNQMGLKWNEKKDGVEKI